MFVDLQANEELKAPEQEKYDELCRQEAKYFKGLPKDFKRNTNGLDKQKYGHSQRAYLVGPKGPYKRFQQFDEDKLPWVKQVEQMVGKSKPMQMEQDYQSDEDDVNFSKMRADILLKQTIYPTRPWRYYKQKWDTTEDVARVISLSYHLAFAHYHGLNLVAYLFQKWLSHNPQYFQNIEQIELWHDLRNMSNHEILPNWHLVPYLGVQVRVPDLFVPLLSLPEQLEWRDFLRVINTFETTHGHYVRELPFDAGMELILQYWKNEITLQQLIETVENQILIENQQVMQSMDHDHLKTEDDMNCLRGYQARSVRVNRVRSFLNDPPTDSYLLESADTDGNLSEMFDDWLENGRLEEPFQGLHAFNVGNIFNVQGVPLNVPGSSMINPIIIADSSSSEEEN